ncbi:MAG: hypothetical protein ABEJ55_03985 [Halanaeroarchaeum sp.]
MTREIDRFRDGIGWIAKPDETMQRASHALVDDGAVWVIDPVDTPDLDDRLDEVGEVAGVVVLLDRHKRDAAMIATRHDVPVYLPRELRAIRDAFDASVQTFDTELATTGYRTIPIVTNRFWREVALYHESDRTLIVPEAVGTGSHFCAPGERLGVHPVLRPFPPRTALDGFEPERILVGHGEGVFDNATTALREPLDGARSRMIRVYATLVRGAARI